MPHYLSYLMGASKIEDTELRQLGIEIIETADLGNRKLKIPSSSLAPYEELITKKLDNGFWNDVVSEEQILFIFKQQDGTVERISLSKETEPDIAKLCSQFSGEPLEKTSNVLNYLVTNKFYEEAVRNFFYKHVPKKYMGAGALFFDAQDKVLLVKPTYKPGWEIPGGIVEEDESPIQTLEREIKEELGLTVSISKTLCIQYVANSDERGDRILFVFDGGVLTAEDIQSIKLPINELSEYRFLTLDEALELTTGSLQSRIAQGTLARKENRIIYFEG